MSFSYPGGIISSTENVPSTSQPHCSGVWRLSEAAYWTGQGQFPFGPSDPNFENVTLLLNGDGTNGAQNNTFLDSSTNNFSITRNGNTTQGSFSPYGSNWSNFFDGTGDRLSLTGATALGTSNYTVEYYVFPTSTEVLQGVFVTSLSAVTGNLRTGIYNGKVYVDIYDGNGSIDIGSAVPLNIWSHIAITKSGSSYTSYLNGAVNTTWTDSTTITGTTWNIGQLQSDGFNFRGYVSNLRVVVGSVVYTGAFTPSNTPLTAITNTQLLTCQSNRFIDNSTSAFALTRTGDTSVQRFSPFNPTAPYSTSVIGGSGYFDGSGDYLTSVTNAAFNFGSGAFTIEAFYYTASTGNQVIVSAWNGSGGGNDSTSAFEIIYFSGILYCQVASGTSAVALTTTTWPVNQWNHVVLVANGSTMSAYLNGTRFATTSFSSAVNDAAYAPQIGTRSPGSSFPFVGYISNARFVKGTAVYDPTSSTLTVPTAPLANITNTSLLTNFTNAGIPDLAMQNNLETVGNAQVSTSVVKYGTGSLAFDGSGDSLSAPANPLFRFGSANFTIEMWVNVPDGSQKIAWHNNGPVTGNQNVIGVGTIAANTWTHVAVTKQGTTLRLFLNGNLDNSGTIAATLQNNVDPLTIGRGADHTGSGASGRDMIHCGETGGNQPKWFFYLTGNGTGDFNGYMDDIRITTGLARYTANFTPPTIALPTY